MTRDLSARRKGRETGRISAEDWINIVWLQDSVMDSTQALIGFAAVMRASNQIRKQKFGIGNET